MNTNTLLVIFGASGDLTHRKLIPALYGLFVRGLLPKDFAIVGVSRTAYDDQSFARHLRENLTEKPACFDAPEAAPDGFCHHVYYQKVDTAEEADFHALKARLALLAEKHQTGGNVLYYLATPPSLYASIAQRLHQVGMNDESQGWKRLIVEKPFGYDTESALALDAALHGTFAEHQIYRIDHYLGKETVQNIMVLRFANLVFESVWNRQFIDHVQITVGEADGVGVRANYYEQAGALKDMFQNHMLQMLTLVAMEAPAKFTADRYRDEKLKVLRAIRPFTPETVSDCAVRGQYAAGIVNGQTVCGYRDEKGVRADSQVETSTAMKVMIDNWRWQGVPFYLRSGKRWNRRVSEIAVVFKRVPHSIFGPMTPEQLTANTLVFKIQPAEGMGLTLEAKRPGAKNCMSALSMDFDYRDISKEASPDAYERLLLGCMASDQTLFVQKEEVELAWSILTPVLDAWQAPDSLAPLHFYPAGEFGPTAAEDLLKKDGRSWRRL